MILNARDASAYFTRPDPGKTGLLIFGSDLPIVITIWDQLDRDSGRC